MLIQPQIVCTVQINVSFLCDLKNAISQFDTKYYIPVEIDNVLRNLTVNECDGRRNRWLTDNCERDYPPVNKQYRSLYALLQLSNLTVKTLFLKTE